MPAPNNRVEEVFKDGYRVYISEVDGRCYRCNPPEIHSWSAPIKEDPNFCSSAQQAVKQFETRRSVRRPKPTKLELAERLANRLNRVVAELRTKLAEADRHIKAVEGTKQGLIEIKTGARRSDTVNLKQGQTTDHHVHTMLGAGFNLAPRP